MLYTINEHDSFYQKIGFSQALLHSVRVERQFKNLKPYKTLYGSTIYCKLG